MERWTDIWRCRRCLGRVVIADPKYHSVSNFYRLYLHADTMYDNSFEWRWRRCDHPTSRKDVYEDEDSV